MNRFMIILGMMVVTYLPRLIPFLTFTEKPLNPKLKQFLEYIPYAALGALIFPGALTAIPNHIFSILIGLTFAGIFSYIKGGIILPVVGSMAVVYITMVIDF